MFTIETKHLLRLLRINQFKYENDKMLFFGLRGCLPVHDNAVQFAKKHLVELCNYDHIHPRCTLGQYHPDKGIALFPGSTVPHLRNIQKSVERGGNGANMLLTGFFTDYRKGYHKGGSPTGHQAFRQNGNLPIRRTADDTDYDGDDRVEYTRPFDNLHAAWSMGTESSYFASAGCQVVVGYPDCEKRKGKGDTGAWAAFKQNAYALEQQSFDYMLLPGRSAQKVALAEDNKLSAILRFGSKGELVSKVQKILKNNFLHYEGRVDGDFGPRMLRAVLEFQEDAFGKDADDGVVGPLTASALGIKKWDKV